MVNAAPLYVPISGDFEATETRRVRVEEASDADTNLQDADLVQALGGFVASGEVVLSSGQCLSSFLGPTEKDGVNPRSFSMRIRRFAFSSLFLRSFSSL
jgi:hypothetical protein